MLQVFSGQSSPYGTLTTTTDYQNNIYDHGLGIGQSNNTFGYTYWYPYYQTIEVEPKKCMGKAHVFECDHVTACQCGKIMRVMPKPKKEKAR